MVISVRSLPVYGDLYMISTSAVCASAVTHGALVAHLYTYTSPRCRTSHYRRTFIPLSVSLWNELADPVFDGVGLVSFKSRTNALLLLLLLKKVGSARPKTPAPQYQPIDRKKRKGKRVEDHSRDKAAQANKNALALLLKSPVPHHRIRG